MTTIRERAEKFKEYENRSRRECRFVDEWITQLSEPHSIDVEYSTMTDEAREDFKNDNRKFVSLFFDDRPEVVELLSSLLAFIGVSKDDIGDWLKFESIYSRDEVCVMLLRYLQGERTRGRMTQRDIADHFGTSTRTIGSYISKLRPSRTNLDKCMIFGQPVEMDPIRGSNVPESTTHPIFLALDLVELRTLVNVLQDHIEGGVESIVVLDILDKIRSQVTEYAAKRLPEAPGDIWITNQRVYGEGAKFSRGIIISEKEWLRARITYTEIDEETDAENVQACEGYISTSRKDPCRVKVRTDNGETREIDYRRIIEFENV